MTLCFSDIETRETFRRLNEITVAFGSCLGAPLCHTLEDYVIYIKEREGKRLVWEGNSPQLHRRRKVIEFIMRVSCLEGLTSDTTYLALYVYDRFSDRHDIMESQLQFVALVCIALAGKLLESDPKVPKFRRLAHYTPSYSSAASMSRLRVLEGLVLESFNFDLLVPTEITFFQYFLLYAVEGLSTAITDANNNVIPQFSSNEKVDEQSTRVLFPFNRVPGIKLLHDIQEAGFLVLEELARCEPVNQYRPSLIAAASLMFARREHGLNFWTPRLAAVTTYSLEEVVNCLHNHVEPRVATLPFSQNFNKPVLITANLELHISTNYSFV